MISSIEEYERRAVFLLRETLYMTDENKMVAARILRLHDPRGEQALL